MTEEIHLTCSIIGVICTSKAHLQLAFLIIYILMSDQRKSGIVPVVPCKSMGFNYNKETGQIRKFNIF